MALPENKGKSRMHKLCLDINWLCCLFWPMQTPFSTYRSKMNIQQHLLLKVLLWTLAIGTLYFPLTLLAPLYTYLIHFQSFLISNPNYLSTLIPSIYAIQTSCTKRVWFAKVNKGNESIFWNFHKSILKYFFISYALYRNFYCLV